MRTVNALAYHLFTTHPGVLIHADALEAYTEIQGAGGHSAIVRRMRNDCNLPIVKIQDAKRQTFYRLDTLPTEEPACVTQYYAKRAPKTATTEAPKAPETPAANPIDPETLSRNANLAKANAERAASLAAMRAAAAVDPIAEMLTETPAPTEKPARRKRNK